MPPADDPDYASSEPVATVDLAALAANYRLLDRLLSPKRLICVVKSDAYGHGAGACARTLESAGASSFAVSRLSEALAIRRAGVRGEILVLGGLPPLDVPNAIAQLVDSSLTPVLQSEAAVFALSEGLRRTGARLDAHLKIDTGLARLGIEPRALRPLLAALRHDDHLQITGICTHFAAADSLANDAVRLTAQQTATFDRAADEARRMHPAIAIHAEGSAAALQGLVRDATHVRLGKALYGLIPRRPPWPRPFGLSPVLSLHSTVVQVREVAAGASVGYGGGWIASGPTVLASVAIGFGDGYPRALAENGYVIVRGQRAPIAGPVSMDLTMVDVTGIAGVAPGDEVTLIGEGVTACDLARAAHTTPSRLTCCLSLRVRRTLVSSTESTDVHVPRSVFSPGHAF